MRHWWCSSSLLCETKLRIIAQIAPEEMIIFWSCCQGTKSPNLTLPTHLLALLVQEEGEINFFLNFEPLGNLWFLWWCRSSAPCCAMIPTQKTGQYRPNLPQLGKIKLITRTRSLFCLGAVGRKNRQLAVAACGLRCCGFWTWWDLSASAQKHYSIVESRFHIGTKIMEIIKKSSKLTNWCSEIPLREVCPNVRKSQYRRACP